MPKDKNQNNNQVNQAEDPKIYHKRVKKLVYDKWMEEEKKKIEAEVQNVQNSVEQKIKEKESEIDQNATKELVDLKERLKKDWKAHLEKLDLELKSIDKKLADKMQEAFTKLEKECQEKEAEEKKKYEKKLQEIEDEKDPILVAVDQAKERIGREKEKCQQEFTKCWAEIAEIGAAIGDFSEQSNNATFEDQRKLQKKIKEQQLALTTANQKLSTWDAAIKELEEEEKKLYQPLEPFEKRKKKVQNEYDQKLAELTKEKIDKMVAEKAKAADERKKLENQYEEDKKKEYSPVRWTSLAEEVENQAKYKKMLLSRNKTAEADAKRKDLTIQMNVTGAAFLKRLYSSVDFGYEVDRLESSEKSYSSSNTAEFTKMVEALKKAEKAVGEGTVSDLVDENIRKSCLEAYKECRNYLQKKDRGWSLLEKMRSRTGKNRIEMARGMMAKLKEFYPDLEEALEAEHNQKNEVQEAQAEERPMPVKKSGKNPTTDVKAELDAAKAQLRKQGGKEAGKETKMKNTQNTNKKTNRNSLG